MTLQEWAQQQSGIVLRIPKGTVIGHHHWYQYPLDHPTHPGEWSTSIDAWKVKIAHEYRSIITEKDQYVELGITLGSLEQMALKATTNKSGKSVDGPIILKRRR
jgi:hypothetical protein